MDDSHGGATDPGSAGVLFIHCDASSHRKCENRGSELAMPQRKVASSENNGKERKDQTESSWGVVGGGGCADRAAADLKKLTRKPDHLRTGRSVTSRERGKNGLVYLGPVVECK